MSDADFPSGCIVCPMQDDWVLKRVAESWDIPNSVVCRKPDPSADYVIYVNHAMWKHVGAKATNQIQIGYFTHYTNTPSRSALFKLAAKEMDHCIAMCAKTAQRLPSKKTTIVHSYPDPQFRKEKIVLGVCHRPARRKITAWIPELEKISGIEVSYTRGKRKFEDLPEWYRSIDYLVVLSKVEGGPKPVLEALAMGVPVIAPDVGWCWEYPVIRYTGLEELLAIVEKLIIPDVGYESEQIRNVITKVCK